MCGIAGILSKETSYNFYHYEQQLHAMTEQLHRRGPDSFGYWVSKNDGVFLGHRRLSIFDVTKRGSQPMESQNNRFIIIFNGEIYNFLELKVHLIKNFKIKFKSNSDTEVLLELFSIYGYKKTLNLIVGMYSIVLWDNREKKLLLSIDPLGKKPLYWGKNGKDIFFASEIKSILKYKKFSKKISSSALGTYLSKNYIKAPNTIYENLFKMEAGTFIVIDNFLNISKVRYWEASNYIYQSDENIKSTSVLEYEIKDLLNVSVQQRMNADVPVGVLLSGGIDSSLITSIAQNTSKKKIKTFTAGFENILFDESVYAKEIAKYLGTDHQTIILDKKIIEEIIMKLPDVYDEPFADSSQVPTYMICNHISNNVTVALSGDGGDEVFAGYSRYIWAIKFLKYRKIFGRSFANLISKIINLFPNNFYDILVRILPNNLRPSDFGHRLKKISRILNSSNEIEIYSKLISNHKIYDLMLGSYNHKNIEFNPELDNYSFIEKMQIHDLENYLPNDILVKVDRASMYNSLEIRSPLIDKRLVEYVLKNCRSFHNIKNFKGKKILRKILNEFLPEKLYERPKMGFGLPINNVLKYDMNNRLEYLFSKQFLKNQNLFDHKKINKFLNKYKNGEENLKHEVWTLFIFQIWYEKWMMS